MKKVILLLTVFFISFQQPIKEDPQPIEFIAQVAEEENLNIKYWQVLMDEKIPRGEFDELMNILESNYSITTLKENNTIKYTMKETDKGIGMNHTFHAVIPSDNLEDVTLQLVIKGTHWDEQTKHRYKDLTKTLQYDYSIQFGRTFTCLKLVDNAIINDGSYDERILKKLNIKNLNEQYDNVHKSTYIAEYYGYTPLWDEKIVVNDEKINVQMVIKETENNHTEIIIGTPIVLNEY